MSGKRIPVILLISFLVLSCGSTPPSAVSDGYAQTVLGLNTPASYTLQTRLIWHRKKASYDFLAVASVSSDGSYRLQLFTEMGLLLADLETDENGLTVHENRADLPEAVLKRRLIPGFETALAPSDARWKGLGVILEGSDGSVRVLNDPAGKPPELRYVLNSAGMLSQVDLTAGNGDVWEWHILKLTSR